MSIENERRLENARAKLRLLQDACGKLERQPGSNAYVDELTRNSLLSQIKQLREDIAHNEIQTAERAATREAEEAAALRSVMRNREPEGAMSTETGVALGIEPTVDYAFKRLFGDPMHIRVLVHLLNALFEGQFRIDGIEILTPFLEKEFDADKLAVLDLRVRDTHGRVYNLEMQTTLPAGLPNRLAYYLSSMYCDQLREGDSYAALAPAISICFLNRVMLPETASFHTRFRLCSLEERMVLTDHLEVHLVELPKYNGQLADLPRAQPKERWAYFLRHASEMSAADIGRYFAEPAFVEAGGVLDMIAKTPEERLRYELRTKALRDQISNQEAARQEAEAVRQEVEAARQQVEAARQRGILEEKQTLIARLHSKGRSIEEIRDLLDVDDELVRKVLAPRQRDS